MADSGLTASPWTSPPCGVTDTSGDVPNVRGTDPLVQGGEQSATQGFDPIWSNAPKTDQDLQETANPVSGLPLRPARFESSGTPPAPPSLKDRQPGTVDEPASGGVPA